ncbi:cyclin-like protein [Crucibulum laeve]|uniref:Cyclin-like protein n=1 Tax=Crucibulum laeve TaxID=68775 RepID=A0A5C3LPR8_9AGAR|nr:cyclin-like protein [Crucibulum laeve]
MATDFWASSHYKRWIVDRATVKRARTEDLLYVDDPDYLDFLAIYFANVITKLGKKLQLRQRVIATATVFFRRFYLKNSYCETDPFVVISACCYVAAKAEESPVHIKNVVAESRALFSQENYNVKNFPTDNSKLAEMEFYLVDDLECDLTVFHPYRTLLTLCRTESCAGETEEGEAGELSVAMGSAGVGIGSDEGPRYWGTGQGQLELTSAALQTAWFIINDTYRSELCLLYPPHLIAVAAIYLTFILHPPSRISSPQSSQSDTHSQSHSSVPVAGANTQPRRSSRNAHSESSSSKAVQPPKPQDPITFLSELNVSLPLVATISQEIISMYALWDRYREDASPDVPKNTRDGGSPMTTGATSAAGSPVKRPSSRSGSMVLSGSTPSGSDLGDAAVGLVGVGAGTGDEIITPSFLSSVLLRMREARLTDMAQPTGGRLVAVNKMLERAQAAG